MTEIMDEIAGGRLDQSAFQTALRHLGMLDGARFTRWARELLVWGDYLCRHELEDRLIALLRAKGCASRFIKQARRRLRAEPFDQSAQYLDMLCMSAPSPFRRFLAWSRRITRAVAYG